jgi:hypothetical protein
VIDVRSLSKRWTDAVPKSWSDALQKNWNQDSLRRVISMRRRSTSPWALMGMFGVGLAVGAAGCYAVTRRAEIKRYAVGLFDAGYESMDEFDGVELGEPSAVRPRQVSGSNHRRKTGSEVTR